ncbi:MAG: hypothetical protein NTZ94_01055, partial [Verrucomicrobia bacterium]|nr:hypothetical protein [Verrucomicrobiota bacterium]
ADATAGTPAAGPSQRRPVCSRCLLGWRFQFGNKSLELHEGLEKSEKLKFQQKEIRQKTQI